MKLLAVKKVYSLSMENRVFVSTVSGTYVPLNPNVGKSEFGRQSFVKLLSHSLGEGFKNTGFVWDEPRWCYSDSNSNILPIKTSYNSVSCGYFSRIYFNQPLLLKFEWAGQWIGNSLIFH